MHTEDGHSHGEPVPDPEVCAKPKRRRFSAEYKLRIVREAAQCTHLGDTNALLRREGLYSSHLTKWRQKLDSVGLAGLQEEKRGRKCTKNPLEDEVARLRKENARLSSRLEQAETIIEIQKKVSSMFAIPRRSIASEEGE